MAEEPTVPPVAKRSAAAPKAPIAGDWGPALARAREAERLAADALRWSGGRQDIVQLAYSMQAGAADVLALAEERRRLLERVERLERFVQHIADHADDGFFRGEAQRLMPSGDGQERGGGPSGQADAWRVPGAQDPGWATDPALRERFFTTLARTVAVDFDGVLHPYTAGWTGSVPDDEPPMEGAREFLTWLREEGYRAVVFSTRCDHEEGLEGVRAWLARHELDSLVDGVTHEKPAAVAYVDDRAVPFEPGPGAWNLVCIGVRRLATGRAHGAGGP